MANPRELNWLIKQWEDVLTKKQFTVSDILRLLIKDTIEALKSYKKSYKQKITGG